MTYDVTERKEDDFLVIAESEKIHPVVFSKAAEFLLLFFVENVHILAHRM